MHKELEQKLVDRWPSWFDTHGDIRRTAMPRGFCHGDGWFEILWRLCGDLEPLVAEFEKETGHRFEVVQVKEKFGGLRFYVHGANDAIRQRIDAASLESIQTCETCGKPGQRRNGRWISTLGGTRRGTPSLYGMAGLSRLGNRPLPNKATSCLFSTLGWPAPAKTTAYPAPAW